MNDVSDPGDLPRNTRPIVRRSVQQAALYIRQAWLVILLALLYGGALAGVQSTLGPLIEENRRKETYDTIPELVPGANKQNTRQVTVTAPDGKQQTLYQANAADGTQKGWVLPAGGLGFAGRIDLLIGLDPNLSTITGLGVLEQKETPGLGDKIQQPSFRRHFRGQPTDRTLRVVKPSETADPETRIDGQIVAVTGATISSEGVARIVNRAIDKWREPIRRLRLAPASTPKRPPPIKGASSMSLRMGGGRLNPAKGHD